MPLLFEPISFRSVTARNRIMVSPMCQYCASHGIAGDWHFVHLGSRAVGGAGIVMAEATLSFLGIGVQEPLPSWGGMIRDGLVALRTDPHMALFSSAALGLTIVGFNLLGDGLRDLLDPRIRDR